MQNIFRKHKLLMDQKSLRALKIVSQKNVKLNTIKIKNFLKKAGCDPKKILWIQQEFEISSFDQNNFSRFWNVFFSQILIK